MLIANEIHDADLGGWIGGVKFYSVDDGTFFVVDADLSEYTDTNAMRFVRRPTVILYTNEAAWPVDMTVDFTFEPGTTHEDAVTAAGFTIE